MNTAAVLERQSARMVDAKFPLLQKLGSSGHSEVYLTELPDQESQKAVIKVFPGDGENGERLLARLEAVAKLSHPHLLRIFHVGCCEINSNPRVYVVMEFADEDLSQILPSRPLTPTEAEEMLRAAADVLAFLHQKGFVHGHLKPSNIMAVTDRLKISSDGIQAVGEQDYRSDELGPYDAPEVVSETLSVAADVWSLGITVVAALNQHPPAWDRVTKTPPAVPDSIPEPFHQIVQECLRLDPAERCTLEQIKALLEPAPAAAPVRKSRTKPLVLAQLALIVILALMWFVAHRGSTAKTSQARAKQESTVVAAPATPPPVVKNPRTGIVKSSVAERVMPNVSHTARNTIERKIRVNVALEVDDSGSVSAAKLERSGPSKYFARLALESARQWKFEPAQVDGQPVPSKWILRYRFGRSETEVSPSQTSP
ncbi:MAG: TonB family protein [Acidobacteriaceae bacterium]|nr:TonB family protein [Acidobacteriaceae bacterium]